MRIIIDNKFIKNWIIELLLQIINSLKSMELNCIKNDMKEKNNKMSDVKLIMHDTFVTLQSKYKHVADIQMRIFNLYVYTF